MKRILLIYRGIKNLLNANKIPLASFMFSRFLIFGFSAIIIYGVPIFFPHTNFAAFRFPSFLKIWTIFDGNAYIKMAKMGYINSGCWSWFPLYPFTTKLLAVLIKNYTLSSLIISNAAFLLGLCVFYRLTELELDSACAKRATQYLSLYPFSYFFSCAYAESLFFLFCVLTFYFIKKGKWLSAGVTAMFVGLTRLIGITIYPSLLYCYINERLKNNKKIFSPDLINILLVPLSILIFMIFLYIKTGDPVAFVSTQKIWHRHISMPHVAILEGLNRFFNFFSNYNYDFNTLKGIFLILLNAIYHSVDVVTLAVSVFLAIGVFKKFDNKYKIFAIFYLLFPLFSAVLLGWPRLIMVFFPFFMYLGILGKRKILNSVILAVFIALAFIFLTAWVRHLYIA